MSDSITCPRCGSTSYHPDDIFHGWCGHCDTVTQPGKRPFCRCVAVYRSTGADRDVPVPCTEQQIGDSPFCRSCLDRHADKVGVGALIRVTVR